jgi:preprotein translocase subunit SecD
VSEFGSAVVELELTAKGAEKLASYSRKNIGHSLVLVKDGAVLSSPTVRAEIPDGKVWIQSNFTLGEANLLAAQLVGRLPFLLTFVGQN